MHRVVPWFPFKDEFVQEKVVGVIVVRGIVMNSR